MLTKLRALSLAVAGIVILLAVSTHPPKTFHAELQGGGHLIGEETRAYIDELAAKWDIRGLCIGIVYLNDRANPGFEYISRGEASSIESMVTENTLFRIGSMTKLFTVMALGILIQDGVLLVNGHKLDWSTRIVDVLPQWHLADAYATEHCNLLDLITMRVGLPGHFNALSDDPPHQAIAKLERLPFSTTFREKFQYFNQGYTVLAEIIRVLTGLPYVDFIQDRILQPLNMTDTYFDARSAESTGRLISGFLRHGQNQTACRAEMMNSGSRSPDPACIGDQHDIGVFRNDGGLDMAGYGGLISSTHDMVKWLTALLKPGLFPQNLLANSLRSEIVVDGNPTTKPELSVLAYGMAQNIQTYRSHPVAWHYGTLPGQQSLMLRAPRDGIGIVILTNDGDYGNYLASIIGWRCLDDIFGLQVLDWEDEYLGYLKKKPGNQQVAFDSNTKEHSRRKYLGEFCHPAYPVLHISKLDLELHLHKALHDESPDARVDQTVLVGELKGSILTPHILFIHHNGELYNWTAMATYPENSPCSDSRCLASAQDSGWAVFSAGKIGMGGNWWGSPRKEEDRAAGKLADEVEFWFERC